MDISLITKKYAVRKLTAGDAEQVYALECGNPLYFEFCPPEASLDSVMEDMKALPPGMTCQDKYYLGFFLHEKLIAVMDLILHYPDPDTAFIGFFMTDQAVQRKGIGSDMIHDLSRFLKEEGFRQIRLGYMKGNEQSRNFWLKNGFTPTGTESDNGQGIVVIMQKQL